MTAGITGLFSRSSPVHGFFRIGHQLARVHTLGPPTTLAFDSMLSKANKTWEAKRPSQSSQTQKSYVPPPQNSSCTFNTDIRQQFGKPGMAAVSARTTQSFPTPIEQRSSLMNQPSMARAVSNTNSALVSLLESKNTLKQESSVVDLTGPDTQSKAQAGVYFSENDFSDDDDLDLDYETPSALPSLPKPPAPTPVSNENMPPPLPSTQSEDIPWTPSPLSHFLPPERQPTSTTSTTTRSLLKRESPEPHESMELPAPKKAKKRVLPASFKKEEPDEDLDAFAGANTPANKQQQKFWDLSASVMKEQKKQLRNQRNQGQSADEPQLTAGEMPEVITSHAKACPMALSGEQKQVLDLVVNKGQSVFFTGAAGTGKSVLMRAIIADLKKKYAKDPERVAVTASTGLAACNIGGITLHSFSGIGLGKDDAPTLIKKIRRNAKAKNRWLRTKCLVIDEVSMVDGDLFDKLSQIGRTIRNNGRPWGGIQLVITGDFFQLPPVPDHSAKRETKFAFDAATWSTSIDHTIGLTQVFRQRDPKFANMLNEMRLGKITEDTVRAFKSLSRPLNFSDGMGVAELFSTRAEVEGSNEKRLRELSGKTRRYDAADTGVPEIRDKLLANMMAPKTIELKLNAQVMLIKNLDESLVNGSLGKVIGFSDEKTFDITTDDFEDEDPMAKAKRKLKGFSRDPEASSSVNKYPVVQFMATDGTPRTILCVPEEWKVELPNGEVQAKRTQLPLILAWALSIHKAQGQTLERVKVNLGRVFEKGQAYVALSRATTQDGLQVLGFEKAKVMAHPRVIQFYNRLYSVDSIRGTQPQSVSDFLMNRLGPVAPKKAPVTKNVIDMDDDEEAMASYY